MLKKEYTVEKDDFASAGLISSQIKQLLQQLGISSDVLRRVAVASYESEINMLIHAYGGKITLLLNDEGYLSIVFNDVGPGILDIEKAMTPGYSTASDKARQMGFGAGMGLFNIKRVSDNFNIESSPAGTILTIGFNL